MTEDHDNNSPITTKITRRTKPHEKFSLSMLFDSLPVELAVEASQTNVEIRDLRPNPKKYRFGKILCNSGALEACIYPLSTLDSILWFLQTRGTQTRRFVTDTRRIRELYALIMKVRYFLRLNKKRKIQYLLRKGFFANINTNRGILTALEKRNLRQYEGIILDT